MLLGKEGDETTRDPGNRHAINRRKSMSKKDLRKSPAREHRGRRLCAHNEPEKSKRGSYRRPMSLTSRSSRLPVFRAISLYSMDARCPVDSTVQRIRRRGVVQVLKAAQPVRRDTANQPAWINSPPCRETNCGSCSIVEQSVLDRALIPSMFFWTR